MYLWLMNVMIKEEIVMPLIKYKIQTMELINTSHLLVHSINIKYYAIKYLFIYKLSRS